MASQTPDEETLAFEALVVREVAGATLDALTELVARILATYAGTLEVVGGALTGAQARTLGAAMARHIRGLPVPEVDGRLTTQAIDARRLGIVRAARQLRTTPAVQVPAPPTFHADAALREALEGAARIAQAGVRTKADAASVAGKVKAARANLSGTARWAAVEGISAGTATVARAAGKRLIWVPERNACLHCLGHAGHAVEPGEEFPAGLSFDPRGSRLRAVKWPPLHPGCRCAADLHEGPPGPPDPNKSRIDPAARLAAEARRSVVYQWTDYASAPAAMRAAEALLHLGAGLPTTVEQRARRALLRGGIRRP